MSDSDIRETTQEKCRKFWEKKYPDVNMPQTYFRWWYEEATRDAKWVLDAGCGPGGSVDHKNAVENAVGLDPDFDSVKKNDNIKYKVVGSVDALPFKDGVFDTVTAQYVIEHLPKPEESFHEISRVSAPGASLIFMTTNSSNYLGAAIKYTPKKLQGLFKKTFLKMDDEEIYPVFMRGNSKGALVQMMEKAGFSTPEFIFIGGPFYFSFSYLLFRGAVFIEQITDGSLKHTKFYIIGRTTKKK